MFVILQVINVRFKLIVQNYSIHPKRVLDSVMSSPVYIKNLTLTMKYNNYRLFFVAHRHVNGLAISIRAYIFFKS